MTQFNGSISQRLVVTGTKAPQCFYVGKKVRQIKHRASKKQYIGVLCLAMVISLSAVGVGFGAWQEGRQVQGVVATGDIDPVFSRCKVVGESSSPGLANVELEGAGNGKRLGIQLQGVRPGYYGHFRYWVKNKGTVPASYRIETINSDSAIEVTLSDPTGVVIGSGEEKVGDLWITVGEVEENTTYDFTVDLVFKQWNALN